MNCPSCDALLSIDLDGNVELAGAGTDADRNQETARASVAPSSIGNETEEEQGQAEALYSFDAPLDPPLDPSERTQGESAVETPKSQSTFGTGLEEVARYGNSEISKANDGSLSFDVTIKGIDSIELRSSVHQALEDARFVWDVDAIMKSVRGGSLKIVDLNPVKASVLINRLKALPVSVSWEQHEITRPQ